MKNKKNPAKFSIQFDINNPEHQEVIGILNQKGRNIAPYIVATVRCYENNSTENLKNLLTEILTRLHSSSNDVNIIPSSSDLEKNFDFTEIEDALDGFKHS